jgi:glyoxylate reductase
MEVKKILIPWKIAEIAQEALKKETKVEVLYVHGPNGELAAPEEVARALQEAHVLIPRSGVPVTSKVLKSAPLLRGIANSGVGYDNIDVTAATALGIPVTNTPGVLTETTADLAFALLMATARRIPRLHNYVLAGGWTKPVGTEFKAMDIGPGGSNRPKVLGIIGFGRIGQAVARRSRGFGMKVVACDPPMKEAIQKMKGVAYRDLDDLLRESDFVSVHTPFSAATRHLIGAREIGFMKPTAMLINTSRGPVVDEKALLAALKKGKIAGAGLDVFEKEPKLTPGLEKLENVVLLPHVGSGTKDTRDQMALLAVRNAVAMALGKKPFTPVNPEVFASEAYRKRIGK